MSTRTNQRLYASLGPSRVGFTASPSNRPTSADLVRGLQASKIGSVSILRGGASDKTDVQIKGFRTVASYNWVEKGDRRTIIVPGEPPIWTPKRDSFNVPPDSKPTYIDQNRAHLPENPFEPLLHSIKIMEPDFDLGSVDVITTRNNLRKLLRFVAGSAEEAFRIDAQLIGNTMLFTRWEHATVESSGQFRGYGANFLSACRTPVRDDAPINHRSVTYDMGGLKFVIGCHVDAQDARPKQAVARAGIRKINPGIKVKTSAEDDLLDAFQSLSVKQTEVTKTIDGTNLRYIRDGSICPDGATIEVHTRSGAREFEYFEAYAQMYLTQTAYLVVARHNRGYFNTPAMPTEKRALDDPYFGQLKVQLQDVLKKMIAVLKEMKKILKENADGKPIAFVFQGPGTTLEALPYKDSENVKLPDNLRKLFDSPSKE